MLALIDRLRRCTGPILGLGASAFCLTIGAGIHAFAGVSSPPAAPAPCTLEPGPTRTVTRIVDAETVLLDDGSELRLAGTLVPRSRDGGARAGSWPPEEAAKAALAKLVLGKSVEIAFGTRVRDRYERRIGHLFTGEAGNRVWVQGEMLADGHARAYALPGDGNCMLELSAHERLARSVNEGLWAARIYAPRPAGQTAALLALRSTFQIVSGKVASISHSKSATYLSFGSEWKSDFTVRIPRSVKQMDAEWAKSLDSLKDRIVEVRGWIERRNGPLISIAHPAEIAPLDAQDHLSVPRVSSHQQTGEPATSGAPAIPEPSAGEHKENRPERAAPGGVDL